MKKAEAGKGDLFTGKAKQLNEVAEDANWRIAVNTELKSAEQWNEDWGFLVAHQKIHLKHHQFPKDEPDDPFLSFPL